MKLMKVFLDCPEREDVISTARLFIGRVDEERRKRRTHQIVPVKRYTKCPFDYFTLSKLRGHSEKELSRYLKTYLLKI